MTLVFHPGSSRETAAPDGIERERLLSAAEGVRSAQGLGRSDMLHRLFDYLLERTLAGAPPKEIEIAADIFGRADADLAVDASVRVYVHRLRRKLEEHYAGIANIGDRLVLPKGEYRFMLAAPEAQAAVAAPAIALPPRFQPLIKRGFLLLAGLLIGGALTAAALWMMRAPDHAADVRETPTWSSLLASRRPLTIVTGDYYIMGERDAAGSEPKGLVRDFAINSPEDLYQTLMYRPELRDRYVDLNLYYLPVSTAYAMKAVMPVVSPDVGQRPLAPIVSASRLTTPMIKDNDIIYVGLLSGLGALEGPVLSGSRFSFAGSYDDIVDGQTGQVHASDPPHNGQATRRNYAYVAMLPGPDGSHILIVAGTRDPALQQAADIVTDPTALRKLEAAGKDGYFEALYAVEGIGSENLRGTLIAAGPRTAQGMWDVRPR